MSLKIFAILFVAVIGVSHASPAFDSDEVEQFNPFGSGRPVRPNRFDGGFGDWGIFALPDFSAFQDYINRIRASIAATIAGAGQGIDLSKGNTTSETKIIDGNRVTVNRTEYNENGVHVVVKNVEVKPVGDSGEDVNSANPTGSTPATGTTGTSAGSTAAPREDIETFGEGDNELARSVESLEIWDDIDSHNNIEIETLDKFPIEADLSNDINVNKNANKQYNDEDVEEFDVNSIHETPRIKTNEDKMQNMPLKENVEVFHDLSGDTYVNDLLARKMAAENWGHHQKQPISYQARPYHDLSRDTYVNELAARRGVTYNPDAEEFPIRYQAYPYQVFPADVTSYRDLSRDTYVNDLAARQGVPKNPDAEELEVELLNPAEFSNNALRKRHS